MSRLLLIAITLTLLAEPTLAFGAGYVSRGSALKTTNFRHGDIALAIPLLATANRRLVKQIYFGNWLRDFSQLLDRSSLSLVPQPVLRALVAVFAYIQFGYATSEFEVTDARLGYYRPEEHVDNPRGYDAGPVGDGGVYQVSEGLRPPVQPQELEIDMRTGMKNYIAGHSGVINPTSAEYVEKQLIAAIACGRQGDDEAYIHLGAALHTLEDFLAHSNYVELAMQSIGRDMNDQAGVTPALGKVFAYVGGAAKVVTAAGPWAPITTGTFGVLDLYQTLLGEIDDKLSAMSLPGIRMRTADNGGALQGVVKVLIASLGGLTPGFEKDILRIQKAALDPHPATWGDLDDKPEKLWQSLEPVFRLRDNIVKWVYDHLTVRAVQDALAAISTAIDKIVYLVLGIFLGPLLSEFSKALKSRKDELLLLDQQARTENVFDAASIATDPTHSQLCKDHYTDELNEIAGRVAVKVSSYTTMQVVQLWQPGNMTDPRMMLDEVKSVFHHPGNRQTPIQMIMFEEIERYVRNQLATNTAAFEKNLQKLGQPTRVDAAHTHVDVLTAMHAPHSIAPQTAHDLVTTQRADVQRSFVERISDNIESQIPGKEFQKVKKVLFSPPSGDSPNPLDSALALCTGTTHLKTFEGVGLGEIASAEGMGELLKDAVVSLMLLDEKRGAEEEEKWGNAFDKVERERVKEMRRMLKLEKEREGFVGDESEKSGIAGKLRVGIEKMKIKVGKKEDDSERRIY